MPTLNAKTKLVPGQVYSVDIILNTLNTDFVLYGKLPDKFSYDLSSSKERWILVPLSYNYDVAIGDLGTDIGLGLDSKMMYHMFDTQTFTSIQYRKVGVSYKWMPTLNANKRRTLWNPVQIISSMDVLNWVK